MQHRGVTLLELLIVIALILSIGALVLPALGDRLGERAFESAAERVRSHMLLARAEAMARRTPLELRYVPGEQSGRITVAVFEPGRAIIEERPEFTLEETDLDPMQVDVEDDSAPEADEQRAILPVLDLASAFRIDVRPPVTESDRLGQYLDDDVAELARDTEKRPIRLVVYLADGSALTHQALWLIDSDDRAARITINPWTGVPQVELDPSRVIEDVASDEEEAFEFESVGVDREAGEGGGQ